MERVSLPQVWGEGTFTHLPVFGVEESVQNCTEIVQILAMTPRRPTAREPLSIHCSDAFRLVLGYVLVSVGGRWTLTNSCSGSWSYRIKLSSDLSTSMPPL